jgi:hypothetical protein
MDVNVMTIAQAARHLRARPRDIRDAIYQGRVPEGWCPWLGRRRVLLTTRLTDMHAVLKKGRSRQRSRNASP